MKIRDIARIGERELITISPNATIADAIKKLVENRIQKIAAVLF